MFIMYAFCVRGEKKRVLKGKFPATISSEHVWLTIRAIMAGRERAHAIELKLNDYTRSLTHLLMSSMNKEKKVITHSDVHRTTTVAHTFNYFICGIQKLSPANICSCRLKVQLLRSPLSFVLVRSLTLDRILRHNFLIIQSVLCAIHFY